jgi:excisionase family DNA binding protein
MVNIEEQFMSVKEFALLMGIHYNTVLRSIKKGRLSAVRIGYGKKATYRICRSEIHRIAFCDLQEMVSKMIEEKIK